MSEIVSQRGIVLKKMPYGEADLILFILFENDGVQRAFVKGARKSKKKFAGQLEIFSRGLFIYKNKVGLLPVFDVQTDSLSNYEIWQEPFNFAFINYVTELVIEFVPQGENSKDLFLLWQQLEVFLQKNPLTCCFIFHFIHQFLQIVGYASSLEACFRCGQPIKNQKVVFDDRHGHLVCAQCSLNQYYLAKTYDGAIFLDDDSWVQPPENNSSSSHQNFAGLVKSLMNFCENILQKKIQSALFFKNFIEAPML